MTRLTSNSVRTDPLCAYAVLFRSGGGGANRGEVGVGVVGRRAGGFPDRDRRPALDERDVLSTPGDPGAGRGCAPLRAVAAAARPACRGAGRGTVVRRGQIGRAHV